MASKLALLAFVALLLLAHAGAWICGTAAGAGEDGAAANAPHVAAAAPGRGESSTPPRDMHILWNAACWLFGVGLVVALGRSSELEPALD